MKTIKAGNELNEVCMLPLFLLFCSSWAIQIPGSSLSVVRVAWSFTAFIVSSAHHQHTTRATPFQYHRSRQCYRLWEALRSLIAQNPIPLTAKFAQSLSLTLFEAAACNSAHLVDRRHPGRDAAEPCRRNGKSAQLAQHTEGWEHKRSDRDVALATTIGILGVFAHIGRRLCTCRITHKTAGNIQSINLGDGARFLFRDDEVPDDGKAIAGNISQCGTKARWLLAARHKNRWNSSSKMP